MRRPPRRDYIVCKWADTMQSWLGWSLGTPVTEPVKYSNYTVQSRGKGLIWLLYQVGLWYVWKILWLPAVHETRITCISFAAVQQEEFLGLTVHTAKFVMWQGAPSWEKPGAGRRGPASLLQNPVSFIMLLLRIRAFTETRGGLLLWECRTPFAFHSFFV